MTAICRGCGHRFEVQVGRAGHFCTRRCYEDPYRATRSRSARKFVRPVSPAVRRWPAGAMALQLLGGVVHR